MCQSQLGTPEEREHAYTPNSVTYMYTHSTCGHKLQHTHTRTQGKAQREDTRCALKSACKCVWITKAPVLNESWDDARGFDAFLRKTRHFSEGSQK